MAQIQKQLEPHHDLTIMVVAGRVTAEQIIDALVAFYEGAFSTNLIWDYTDADLTAVANDELRRISAVADRYAHLRKAGKTAIIVPEVLGYGLGRMYETISEMNENPVRYHIFKTRAEARQWIET